MLNKQNIQKFKKIAQNVRLSILEMITKGKCPHIGSNLSAVDILTALYFKILKINPKKPNDPNRDRFILSKGHAAAALYAVLAERGFADKEKLKNYSINGGNLPGHASRGYLPGIEINSGSLGHGLPIANGMALAAKKDKKNYRVFALLSDGECDEGSNWEAILFAAHHKLDNLVVIIDCNKWQAFGRTKDVMNLEPFVQKWKDFGWSVKEADGHDFREIFQALKKIPFEKNKPSVLIAHTVKGKGVSFMEDKLEWHYRNPNEGEYKIALKEIKKES